MRPQRDYSQIDIRMFGEVMQKPAQVSAVRAGGSDGGDGAFYAGGNLHGLILL
jgi:hypothetical protein